MITSKEFKQILKDTGNDLEVFGYEGIINMMSGYYGYLADKYKEENNTILHDMFQKKANDLYDVLKVNGYYNR